MCQESSYMVFILILCIFANLLLCQHFQNAIYMESVETDVSTSSKSLWKNPIFKTPEFELNVYTLDQELNILKLSVVELGDRIDKSMQILDSKYKDLEGKLLNMEKHLDNKCDKQKCKKIFHKMNKIETKFMNKFLMLMREVTEIDDSKCSTAKCQEIEAKMTNISSQVEAVTGDTTIVTSVPGVTPQSIAEIHTIIGELKEDKCSKSSCEKMESDIEILNTDNTAIQDDLKNIENHIEDLDNTKCSKSNCEKIASDITALQGDIDRIEEEKCDGRLCEEIAESIGGLCDRQDCENTAIGLSNLGEVVDSLYTTQEEMLQELVNSKLALENVTSCMREPSLPVCTVEYGTAGLTAQLQGVTSCLSDPSSSSCSTTFPQSSSLPAVLSSKCSSSVCSSLESCFTQPGGDQCRDSYGSDVAPLGLVSLIPNIQTWIEVLRDPPKLQCSKTTNTLPGKSPTEGPEIWLVSFDECQDFQSDGGEGAIKPLFDNSFFEVNTSGEFFVSLTYLPVVIGGKPLRVSILVDRGTGGEPVVFGQSSSARDITGVQTSAVDFSATSTITTILTLSPGEGIAVRLDFIGNGNAGYLASSKKIIRTFLTVHQIGWN